MSSDTPEEVTGEETTADETVAETAESEVASADTPAAEPAPTEEPAAAETTPEEPAVDDQSLASELTLGSGAPADEELVDAPAPTVRGKIDRFGVAMGTGRRKTAIARVRVKEGDGKFVINGRPIDEYFGVERDRLVIMSVLETAGVSGNVDIWVRANGGGTTGQTGAVILGIARALQARDPGLHHTLSAAGYLTRDGRMVERKKYGLRKARRSFQFSKR